ncbi:MAG: hypothetical protein AB1671_04870 [Thermodesulfobacteriota bacterium]|jgi:hypothetical protein
MVSYARTGARCRTLRNILTPKGILPRGSYGTLRYETTTFGRRVILVDWDQGLSVPVPPHEVEIRKGQRP